MRADITTLDRPVPVRRYVVAGLAVLATLFVVLNWQTVLSFLVLAGLVLLGLALVTALLVRLALGKHRGDGSRLAVLLGAVAVFVAWRKRDR
ncbi:hypothetical protein [Frondihabitans cladoniiphilus]|uniref:Uncharacterized protein n=1 Tax=Frondihabitans cladoniiphilus TaxID=715785 RepID=A0ABP8WAQ2_9MICO